MRKSREITDKKRGRRACVRKERRGEDEEVMEI